MDSVMPRLSRSSAISAAVLDAVPRSITRESSHVRPGAPAGSNADPARVATLIDTAGVAVVCFASRTAPLPRTARSGARPAFAGDASTFMVRNGKRLEAADGTVGRSEYLAGHCCDVLGADRLDTGRRGGEDFETADRLEVAELMGDVGDAVALEDEPGAQLRFRFRELGSGDAVPAHAVDLLD